MSDLEEAARIYDKMLLDDIKSIKYIQHKLESIRTVLSTKNGQIRKLREAVIQERAKRNFYSSSAFDGDSFEYYAEYHERWLSEAESELRAKGVIE